MKVLFLVWSIVQMALLAVGGLWAFIDRKSEKRKKTPWILVAIGSFMMAVFFLVFLPKMGK